MPDETPPTDADGTAADASIDAGTTDATASDVDATDVDATDVDATDAAATDPAASEGETTTSSTATEHVETSVPADRSAHRCPYCDRPFATEERVTLHVGLTHYDVCTDAEVEAFEDAYVAETQAIKRYRLKAAAVLVLVYFGFLMVYAVFGVAG